jgi:type II secretion system protein H
MNLSRLSTRPPDVRPGLARSSSSSSSSSNLPGLPSTRKRRTTRTNSSRSTANLSAQAFTLIELILVLALLAVTVSLVAPSLSHFFRGRALDSEARQLLSLTHAGQSRAISEGWPMLLWIDSQAHAYGLEAETSSRHTQARSTDSKAEEFTFEAQLEIQAVNASPMPVNGRSLPAIRFLPDGTIDETSAATLRLATENSGTLWLIQSTNRLSYEIRASNS